MKIAFLSFYSGQIDRGVEVATTALARGLSRLHHVDVFQTGNREFSDVKTTKIPLNIHWQVKDISGTWIRKMYLDYWSRKIGEFTFKALPFLLRQKYDVVIPTNGGWQVVIIRLFTWVLGKKMLVQGNAGIGYDDLFQLLCFPDHYIAISPNGYKWAARYKTQINKSFIPYGVDLKQFASTKAREVPLKKPIVLCVAAFSPYKQIDLLIKAMEKVPETSLLVVGQGSLEHDLRTLGKRLLGQRFMLKTGVIHQELIGYYKAADLFSLPSAPSEALGIVYIEAMAAGLPVVAPDDWRKDIVGEAGVYVDPKDTPGYASAIKKALATNWGNKPIKEAQKFSWDRIVAEYEKILNHL